MAVGTGDTGTDRAKQSNFPAERNPEPHLLINPQQERGGARTKRGPTKWCDSELEDTHLLILSEQS